MLLCAAELSHPVGIKCRVSVVSPAGGGAARGSEQLSRGRAAPKGVGAADGDGNKRGEESGACSFCTSAWQHEGAVWLEGTGTQRAGGAAAAGGCGGHVPAGAAAARRQLTRLSLNRQPWRHVMNQRPDTSNPGMGKAPANSSTRRRMSAMAGLASIALRAGRGQGWVAWAWARERGLGWAITTDTHASRAQHPAPSGHAVASGASASTPGQTNTLTP